MMWVLGTRIEVQCLGVVQDEAIVDPVIQITNLLTEKTRLTMMDEVGEYFDQVVKRCSGTEIPSSCIVLSMVPKSTEENEG